MGLINFFNKVINAPRKVYSDLMRKAGEVLSNTGSYILWNIGDTLQNFADKIEPKCYKSNKATGAEVVDFSARCKEYYNLAIQDINPKIEEIVNEAKKELSDIKKYSQICVSAEVFDEIKLIYDNVTFDAEREEFESSIGSAFSNDNKAFLKIVEIDSDDERKRKFNEYTSKKTEELGVSFTHTIKGKKNEYATEMLNKAQEYCEQLELNLNEIKERYDELIRERKKPEFVSNRFAKSTVDIAYSECVLSLLYQNN